MMLLAHTPPPPYYACIFTSIRSGEDQEYETMAGRMLSLATRMEGFLGVESARTPGGLGMTVSYWASLEAMRLWKENAEHRIAQTLGKEQWYRHYRVRVCRVEREGPDPGDTEHR